MSIKDVRNEKTKQIRQHVEGFKKIFCSVFQCMWVVQLSEQQPGGSWYMNMDQS